MEVIKMGSMKRGLGLLAVILVLFGCKEKGEERPSQPQGPDIAEVLKQLDNLSFDQQFFAGLDLVRSHAQTSEEAQKALVRLELDALAAGVVARATWLPSLIGGPGTDPAKIGDFLRSLGSRSKDKGLEKDLRALASAFDGKDVSLLDDVFQRAEGDDPLAPAIRLLLGRRLYEALVAVSSLPEPDRGPELMRLIPGLPNPPTSDPLETAIPRTLKRLYEIASKGPSKEQGLRPYYETLLGDISKDLGERVFSLPVVLEPQQRPSTPPVYLGVKYSPLITFTLKDEGLHIGLRHAFVITSSGVADLSARIGWPGQVVAPLEALLQKGVEEKVMASLEEVQKVAGPIEEKFLVEDKEVLNENRKAAPKAAIWLVSSALPARYLEAALDLASKVGFGDIRIAVPGALHTVLPVFYRKVPDFEGAPKVEGKRVLVALGKEGVEVYPPKGARLDSSGWPEGVQVLRQGMEVAGFRVPWRKEAGFGGVVAKVISRLREATKAAPVVPVVVRSRDVPVEALRDVASEVLASEGAPFEGLGAFFPGLYCAEGRPCPSAIPILFAGDRLPEGARPQVAVEVSRPSGFCDKKDVERVMNGRAGAVRACYEMALQRNPDLAGRLEVRFTIEEDGSVSGLTVERNELTEQVAQCVIRQISSLRFPKPAGGVCIIRWPYRFQPGG